MLLCVATEVSVLHLPLNLHMPKLQPLSEYGSEFKISAPSPAQIVRVHREQKYTKRNGILLDT
jgi:hypothetical protein